MAEATARGTQLCEALHAALKRAGMAARVNLTQETAYALIFEYDGQMLTIDEINPAQRFADTRLGHQLIERPEELASVPLLIKAEGVECW